MHINKTNYALNNKQSKQFFMSNKLYIDLLKMVLIDMHRLNLTEYKPLQNNNTSWKRKALYSLNKFLAKGTKGKFAISEVHKKNRVQTCQLMPIQ